MKFIFKKYIDFEKIHGDQTLVEYVKEMALKYVENKEQVFKMALPKQLNEDNVSVLKIRVRNIIHQ